MRLDYIMVLLAKSIHHCRVLIRQRHIRCAMLWFAIPYSSIDKDRSLVLAR
ncbi:hypothetical protein RSAG8_09385, partial [Rhizoctonia solani AG-8 WAC10335]